MACTMQCTVFIKSASQICGLGWTMDLLLHGLDCLMKSSYYIGSIQSVRACGCYADVVGGGALVLLFTIIISDLLIKSSEKRFKI